MGPDVKSITVVAAVAIRDRRRDLVMAVLGRHGPNSPPPDAGAGAGGAVAPDPVPLGVNSLVVVVSAGTEAGRERVALLVSGPTRPVTRSCSGCARRFTGDRVAVAVGVRVCVAVGVGVRVIAGGGEGLTRAMTAVAVAGGALRALCVWSCTGGATTTAAHMPAAGAPAHSGARIPAGPLPEFAVAIALAAIVSALRGVGAPASNCSRRMTSCCQNGKVGPGLVAIRPFMRFS